MKKNLITLFFCAICLLCCHSKKNISECKRLIKLYFYPTGMIDDTRYSIFVIGDSLIVNDLHQNNGNEQKKHVVILSNYQINIIDSLISTIKTQYKKQFLFEDTWGVTLIINNQVIYEDSDFSLESPPYDVKKLIKFLIDLSPVSICLDGFS